MAVWRTFSGWPIILGCAAALSAVAHDDNAQYSISAPGTTLTGYVTGTTLPVSVTAPTGKHAERVTLKLNGTDLLPAGGTRIEIRKAATSGPCVLFNRTARDAWFGILIRSVIFRSESL